MDVRCLDDLDSFGTEITDPLEELFQDNYHRIVTPPGQNIDDPDFGLGLPRLLSGSSTDLISLGPRIEAELRKDRRNAAVQALITPLESRKYAIAITIVPDPELVGTTETELVMNLLASSAGVEVAI